MADERSPDHTDDPRKQETGSGGYPESTPAGTEGGGERAREGDTDAPSPSTEKEADREHSTGNPGAAG
ncbi:MAG TPA: hypothetical protein VNT03_05015 [Baekduia sp.]|nr:hypothetical protein [Baekduia sp.]